MEKQENLSQSKYEVVHSLGGLGMIEKPTTATPERTNSMGLAPSAINI